MAVTLLYPTIGNDQMSRKLWLIFLAVQTLGEVCAWMAGHFLSALGPGLWVAGWLLLLPGNITGALVVEKLLWMSRLTILQLMIVSVPIELATNAAVWLLCARVCRYACGYRVANDGGA